MRGFLGLICIALGMIGAPAFAQTRPPQYYRAEQNFLAMPVPDRMRFELMLTAAGYWPAVPNEDFNARLFEAITRFQAEQGFAPTGFLAPDQMGRLLRLGQPVIDDLGLRAVPHPDRGHLLWVPMGLGLAKKRTATGLEFSNARRNILINYDYYADVSLERRYETWIALLTGTGAHLGYRVKRRDFFVIVADKGDESMYVRYHEDGDGIVGFFLAYDSTEQSVHGYQLQTFMSASLWSAMSPQAPNLPLPVLSPPASPPAPPSPPAPSVRLQPSVPNPTPTIGADPATPSPSAPKEGSGTAFFVNAEGYVLTNAHVVDDCSRIELLGSAESSPVKLVAKDKTNDLALLKTGVTPQKFAQLRTGVRLGEQVVAFGYPLMGVLSTGGNFTLGNVTSLTGLKDDIRYLQISTPVQPGNSGGPLLDASGNFVGVVSAKLNALLVMLATNGDIPQNVNFAIKSSVAATFLESNGVSFQTGTLGAPIAPTELADIGKAISMPVLCK